MSDHEANAEVERLRIVVSNGIPGDQTLLFRVSPQGADELQALMEAEDVYDGRVLEHALGPDLIVLAGAFAAGGGMKGLAAVMTAFFSRNQHKQITLTRGDETIDLKGLSAKETDEIIDRVLGEARQSQLERNDEWRRIAGINDEPGDGSGPTAG